MGGRLNGLEFNLQPPFSFVPVTWSNVGLLANYADVKSKITYIVPMANPNTTINELIREGTNFVDLSPRAANLTLYHKGPSFSAQVSAVHRSDNLMNLLGNVAGHGYTLVDGSINISLNFSFNLTPQLLPFKGQNLNDEPQRYKNQPARRHFAVCVFGDAHSC